MFTQPSKLPARALAAMALTSFAAVGVALVAQHQFGVKPCPWCVCLLYTSPSPRD